MNGGHDLGGMHGLGPINPEPENDEPVFHSDWEKRVFALTLAAGFLRKWSLDESRYAKERQHPADYLRNSYYENWLSGLETLLLEKGMVSQTELASGQADPTVNVAPSNVLLPADVETALLKGGPVDMNIERDPRFEAGDEVRVINLNPAAHTRVPRYARGKRGVVDCHHGAHVFADSHALGQREGQHLYSVSFTATELWGREREDNFRVSIDFWEPHLEAL